MMEYKGYFAKVEFDDETDIFHGEVINLRDVVTFRDKQLTNFTRHSETPWHRYLEFCAERGEEPDKPYSGKFMVRVEPELHKTIAIRARQDGKSLNSWVHDTLTKAAGSLPLRSPSTWTAGIGDIHRFVNGR